MARKEVWDSETLLEELERAHEAFASIPRVHLRRIQRALHVNIHYERHMLADRFGGMRDPNEITAQLGYRQGYINALSVLKSTVDGALDGTLPNRDVGSDEEARENYERESAYRYEFDGPDFDD